IPTAKVDPPPRRDGQGPRTPTPPRSRLTPPAAHLVRGAPHVASGRHGRQNRCWRRSEEAPMSTDPDIQWNAPVEAVLTARQGSLGRIRLNRPRPINALTLEMIEYIHQALRNFGQDESISAVDLDGAGERGLCSGADVRGIREGILSGTQDPETFFRAEYALDQEIAAFAKPVAAFMDGVVMGGGLG